MIKVKCSGPQNEIITARKRSLQRLCFYTCLSFCPKGGVHGGVGDVCGWGHAWWGGVHGGRVYMAGGLCMAGGMSGRGHAWQGACMAREGLHGGGHAWWGGHAWQGVVHSRGHSWPEGACMVEGGMHGGCYASYWNAFLLISEV